MPLSRAACTQVECELMVKLIRCEHLETFANGTFVHDLCLFVQNFLLW